MVGCRQLELRGRDGILRKSGEAVEELTKANRACLSLNQGIL